MNKKRIKCLSYLKELKVYMIMQKSTIELKHKDKINLYSEEYINIENLKTDIRKLEDEIKKETNLKKSLSLNNDLNCLKNQVEKIDTRENEIEYLLNVVPILNKYNDESKTNELKTDKMNKFIIQTKGKEKGTLYNEFMNVVENKALEITKKENVYMCIDCEIPKVLSILESCTICPNCGNLDVYFDTGLNNLSYEQEINSEGNITFAYKRINHFNEWLAQFQAKEAIEIPDKILEDLRNEFHKLKIKNVNEITKSKVKQCLKKLKYNKYYEHVTHITNLLNGIKPPSMTQSLEEKLRNMFRDIQIPFEINKPENRSNFLSYSYCLYKFCELLGYDELLCHFPLLKSREKLHQQDKIWQGICQYLSWQYIATV